MEKGIKIGIRRIDEFSPEKILNFDLRESLQKNGCIGESLTKEENDKILSDNTRDLNILLEHIKYGSLLSAKGNLWSFFHNSDTDANIPPTVILKNILSELKK